MKSEAFDPFKQKTLGSTVSFSGIGLFTGEHVELKLHPLAPGSGILFQRTDVEGSSPLAAELKNVVSTPRCTILGNEQVSIHTVEHLLAALYAMGLDNLLIELNGPEVPIVDGSARPFVQAIKEAGFVHQEADKEIHKLTSPLYWSQSDVHLVALPSDELRISYTLHYPQSTYIGSQYCSFAITPETFEEEISPSRTFCLYEEILPFIEKGLIKGGGPDNAVIIKEDQVINSEGVRFSDEMARHKVLDLIGDLSLIPPFTAHIIAIRSGHASNISFAAELMNHLNAGENLNGR